MLCQNILTDINHN